MSGVHETPKLSIEHESLDASKVVSGNVTTGALDLGVTPSLRTGIWEHAVGVSTDVESEEVFVVLSGKGRVFLPDGSVHELYPGVVGRLLTGEHTRWEVDETLRKVYIVPNK